LVLGVTAVPERVEDFGTHFSAAWPQARADCRDEVGRIRPEFFAHRLDRDGRSAPHRATPSRMCRANDTPSSIGKQHRSAIRDPDADRRVPIVADHDVGFGTVPALRRCISNDRDVDAVDLADQPELRLGDADALGNGAPLGGVAWPESQVGDREQVRGD
jgi:hypothetical protein